MKAKETHDLKLQHESKARDKIQAKEEALIAQPADAIIMAGEDSKRRKGKGKSKGDEDSQGDAAAAEVQAEAEAEPEQSES